MGTKDKKSLMHASYNKKVFLAPNIITSMAVIHTKIKPCGEAQIRISDCNSSIKLWNDLNDKSQAAEMLQKVETLLSNLEAFRDELKIKLTK